MSGKVIRYFARGNTAKGFYSLLESNLQHIEQIFILDGGTDYEKKACLKLVAETCVQKDWKIELIHCAADPDAVEGVILLEKKSAIFMFDIANNPMPAAKKLFVNIPGSHKKSDETSQAIIELAEKSLQARDKAYTCFQYALAVHDEWEALYIQALDKKRANELTKEWIQKLVPNKKPIRKSLVKHRFLGAATPKGAVDFVDDLTDGLDNRYFIKGRPGSGKSTMMKKIATASIENGYDTEIYHCGFDPNSVDMVIVREAGFAIFDSTAPHEYFPEKSSDEVIDLYKEIVQAGTDEMWTEEIKDISSRYRQLMNEATSYLQESKKCKDQIEMLYQNKLDEVLLQRVCQELLDNM